VEKLWMNGALAVENLTAKIFLESDRAQIGRTDDVDGAFAIRFA
jgi:hypothetical protein